MYLSHIRIKSFRNFEDFEVPFQSGLNLVVGENNIGKSNLFDALRIALGYAAFGRAALRAQRSDLHRNDKGEIATTFEIHLEFTGVSKEDLATFLECVVYDPKEPARSLVRIGYRWTWDDATQRYTEDRWGGDLEERGVKAEALQYLPSTYLEPLRDALTYLSAGRGSRISTLLTKLGTDDERERIVNLVKTTNRALRNEPLIKTATTAIVENMTESIGTQLSPEIGLAPAVPTFDAIAQSIRATLRVPGLPEDAGDGDRVDVEISENGMGYNNLLYIATVLAYRSVKETGDVPLLIIEEPEAHLHPQLQLLLADFLLAESQPPVTPESPTTPEEAPTPGVAPQVFLTTHSPTLASHIAPDRLVVMHRPAHAPRTVKGASLSACGLSKTDVLKLQRLLDVTKASLFFARGVLLVEGITEQLLIPVLARRLGTPLEKLGVSVIALHGLSFETLLRLFGGAGLELPCAVVTDSDPPVKEVDAPLLPELKGACWREVPKAGAKSTTLDSLRNATSRRGDVAVFAADVTLEYDLALAGNGANAAVMVDLWPEVTGMESRILTPENLNRLGTTEEKARFCWQALCRKDGGRYKGAFAQALASKLAGPTPFEVPTYLAEAIRYVTGKLTGPSPSPEPPHA